MHRKQTLGILTLAGSLLFGASLAQAQTKYQLGSNTFETERAGKAHQSTPVKLGVEAGNRGIWRVEGRESSDTPAIIANDRHLNSYDTAKYTQNGMVNGWGSAKAVGFEESETYIRGIAVCLNNAKTKIKGVKIWGTRLDRNTGALENLPNAKKWERTNCKYWGESKYCKPGQIASRLFVYAADANGGGAASAISLECRAVKPK